MPSTWSTISSSSPNSSGDKSSNHGPSSTWDILEHSLISSYSDSSSPDALLAHPPRSPTLQPRPPLAVRITSEIAYLLHAYQTGVATWMDLFDHGCTYQRVVSRQILDSELLLHCVCAFTAKNLSLLPSGMAWVSAAAYHYGESLRLLRELLNNSIPQENALTAIILLSSYEMIAAQGQELQRHFFGATLLIRTYGISAGSHGINRANFWIYIRHEIVVALVNESPMQMSPNEWNVRWRDGETEEDVFGNQLLWLVGRAIDVVFAKDPNTQEPMPIMVDARNDLLREVDRWLDTLPSSFRAISYGEPTDEGFSRLHYSLPTVSAAMIWYHVLHILLYAEPYLHDLSDPTKIQYHASQIASIAISDITDTVRSFSSQALFYAAKHIKGLSGKTRLWALMNDLEIRLGFHTRSRVRKLQQLLETETTS